MLRKWQQKIITTGCDGLLESLQDTRPMNISGESQKETLILSTKTKTGIGFWNLKTTYETGKLAQVAAEMRRYNLYVLEINESRWTGSGRYITNTERNVLYCGRNDNHHHEGVAVMLGKEWRSAWSTSTRWRSKWRGSTLTLPTSSVMHWPTTVRKRARMHFTTSCKLSRAREHTAPWDGERQQHFDVKKLKEPWAKSTFILLHSTQHHRTVHWMAEGVVHQLRGFWEGFRQHLPRKSMAHTQGIWNSTTDRPCHQELLQQPQVQSGKQLIQLQCESRC